MPRSGERGSNVGAARATAVEVQPGVVHLEPKIPGQPFARLNWGAHGAPTNRVWFWTAAWNIPADFPLGTTTFRIVFKTEANKFGMYDHVVTITP